MANTRVLVQRRKAIQETKALDDDTAAKLKDEIEAFKSNQWKPTEAPD